MKSNLTLALHRQEFTAVALIVIALVATVVLYWPGLSGALLLDDIPQLGGLIAEGAESPAMLFGNYTVSTSGPLGRPISMATFITNAMTHGPDIWWWKFDNLMLHLICGLLTFWWLALLLRAAPAGISRNTVVLAALVVAIWLVHPLNLSTVLYTVQRMTILSTLFALAGLVCYTRGRVVQIETGQGGWLQLLASIAVFLPLAALCKESGLLLLLYISLLEFVVFRFRGRDRIRNALRYAHGALVGSYVLAGLLLLVKPEIVTAGYEFRDFTVFERTITQFRVLITYLTQIALPLPWRTGFFHDDFAVSRGLLSPPSTLICAVLVIGIIAAAIAANRRWPLVSFGVLFFFATHAMESTVFGLELMFEHRNYLGSVGVIFAVILGLSYSVRSAKWIPTVAGIAFLAFAVLTQQRAAAWSEPVSMYRAMYVAHPTSPRINIIFSNIFAAAGEYENSRRMLGNVAAGPGRDLHALYLDCLQYGRVDAAAFAALTAPHDAVIDAHVTSSLDSLTNAIAESRCVVPMDAFAAALDRVLEMRARSDLDRRAVLFAKASVLDSSGQVDPAIDAYRQAQDLSPADATSLYRAADLYARHGRLDEARRVLDNAAAIERNVRIVRKDLAETIYLGIADAYMVRDQQEDALSVYAEAIASMPGRAAAYVALAELQARLGRPGAARQTLADLRRYASNPEAQAYRVRRLELILERTG